MSYILAGPVSCYPVCRLLSTFAHRGFPYTPPVAPPPPIPLVGFPSTPPPVASPSPLPLGTTHGGCVALPTQLCLILVSPCHEPFGCFKDPSVSLPRNFCLSGPQRGINSKHQGRVFRRPFGGSELPKVFDYAFIPSLKLSARSRVLRENHRPDHYPTG